MRKQLFRLLLAVSVYLVFATVAAQAQSMRKMTVQVPFTFHVFGKQYPAGTYVVVRNGPFLYLRDGSRVLSVWTLNSLVTQTVPKESKLVFFEYRGVHLLTQVIWRAMPLEPSSFAPAARRKWRGKSSRPTSPPHKWGGSDDTQRSPAEPRERFQLRWPAHR